MPTHQSYFESLLDRWGAYRHDLAELSGYPPRSTLVTIEERTVSGSKHRGPKLPHIPDALWRTSVAHTTIQPIVEHLVTISPLSRMRMQVVEAVYCNGIDQRDICKFLGMDAATLKIHLREGKTRIRKRLRVIEAGLD